LAHHYLHSKGYLTGIIRFFRKALSHSRICLVVRPALAGLFICGGVIEREETFPLIAINELCFGNAIKHDRNCHCEQALGLRGNLTNQDCFALLAMAP